MYLQTVEMYGFVSLFAVFTQYVLDLFNERVISCIISVLDLVYLAQFVLSHATQLLYYVEKICKLITECVKT